MPIVGPYQSVTTLHINGLNAPSRRHRIAEWTEKQKTQLCAAHNGLTSVLRTLCDPVNGSPSGFSVPGILQARTLEWVSDRQEIVKMVRTHNYLLSLTSFLTM